MGRKSKNSKASKRNKGDQQKNAEESTAQSHDLQASAGPVTQPLTEKNEAQILEKIPEQSKSATDIRQEGGSKSEKHTESLETDTTKITAEASQKLFTGPFNFTMPAKVFTVPEPIVSKKDTDLREALDMIRNLESRFDFQSNELKDQRDAFNEQKKFIDSQIKLHQGQIGGLMLSVETAERKAAESTDKLNEYVQKCRTLEAEVKKNRETVKQLGDIHQADQKKIAILTKLSTDLQATNKELTKQKEAGIQEVIHRKDEVIKRRDEEIGELETANKNLADTVEKMVAFCEMKEREEQEAARAEAEKEKGILLSEELKRVVEVSEKGTQTEQVEETTSAGTLEEKKRGVGPKWLDHLGSMTFKPDALVGVFPVLLLLFPVFFPAMGIFKGKDANLIGYGSGFGPYGVEY